MVLWVIKVLLYITIFAALATPMVVAPNILPYISTFPQAMYFRILVEIALILWAILFFFKRVALPSYSRILGVTMLYFAVLTLASIFGFNPARSFWGTLSRAEGLFTLLHFLAFFLLLISVLRTPAQWKWVLRTIVLISVLIGIVAILQTQGILTLQGGGCELEGCTRVNGTFGNTGFYGGYLVMIIFLAIFLAVHEKKRLWKWCFGLLALADTVLLLMTGTRAGWVAVGVGIVILGVGWFCFLSKTADKKRLILLAGLGLISLSLLVAYLVPHFGFAKEGTILATIHNRLDELTLSIIKSDDNRFFVGRVGLQAWKEHPWLGSGLESFAYHWERLFDPALYRGERLIIEPFYNRAHNVWIDLLVNAGIVGLAAYFLLLAIAIRTAVRARGQISRYGSLVLLTLFIGHEIHNLFSFDTMATYLIFFVLLAFLHIPARERIIPEEPVPPSQSWFNRLGAIGLIGIIPVILFFFNVRPVRAAMLLMQGFNTSQVSAIILALEQAQQGLPEVLRAEIQHLAVNRFNEIALTLLPLNQDDAQVQRVKAFTVEILDKFILEIETRIKTHPDIDRLRNYGLLIITKGLLYDLTEDQQYLEQGQSTITQALDFNPRHPFIFKPAAELYMLGKELQPALDMYTKAFSVNGDIQTYLKSQGMAYIIAGKTQEEREKGVELYRRFLKLSEFYTSGRFDPSTIRILAEIYEKNDNYKAIVQVLEETLNLLPDQVVPNDYQFYGTLARAYLKVGQRTKAKENIALAKQLFPKFAKELDGFLKPVP